MKPSITPDLVDRFRAYIKRDPALFHVVLEDNNTEDHFARSTLDNALESNDREAIDLAGALVDMSRTQRRKLGARLAEPRRTAP